MTVSSVKAPGALYPAGPPHPSLIFPLTRAEAAAGRHLSCLPSRQTCLCAQGARCHGNPQFPFQWGLAAGASPFSGVSQSRSHQATHCFLRTCLKPLIVGSDPLSGARPQQEAWGCGDPPPSPGRALLSSPQLEQGQHTCPPLPPPYPLPPRATSGLPSPCPLSQSLLCGAWAGWVLG